MHYYGIRSLSVQMFVVGCEVILYLNVHLQPAIQWTELHGLDWTACI